MTTEVVDTASEVGALFRRAHASHLDTVRLLIDCGASLMAQKSSLPAGEWLLWVKAHEATLGFGLRTAQRLMGAAREHASLTSPLDPDTAARINRAVWGNEPNAKLLNGPSLGYVQRFFDWTAKHDTREFEQMLHELDPESLKGQIERTRSWLAGLEELLQPRLQEVA